VILLFQSEPAPTAFLYFFWLSDRLTGWFVFEFGRAFASQIGGHKNSIAAAPAKPSDQKLIKTFLVLFISNPFFSIIVFHFGHLLDC